MTDRYAIFGNPVAHSKSPEIHAFFAQVSAQDLSYERILAPLDGFAAAVDRFRAEGGRGGNVTLPFKVEAFHYANQFTARARQAGAVNTFRFDGEVVIGDNTDGIGMCRDITANLGVALKGARVLLLGAGGAARGVVGPLLDGEPELIVIANRTAAKAEEIAAQFAGDGPVSAVAMPDLGAIDRPFDIIINATSASIGNSMPPLPPSCVRRGALAYEMIYGKGETPFMKLAADAGARTADGLGMLIEQAAEGFLLWRGILPSTAALLEKMRS